MAGLGSHMRGGHARNDQRRAQGAETSRTALDLRRAGASYRQIAQTMGISHGGAEKAVKRALKLIVQEPAEDVLKLELDRLDAMLMGLWPEIQKGSPNAVRAGVRVMERRAALLGLDKPARVNVSVMVQQAVDQFGLTPDEAAALAEDIESFIAEQKAVTA